MTEIDEKLHELQEKAAQKRRYETMEQELNSSVVELRQAEKVLDEARRAEQADVDRLEGHSLAALFYGLTGQKEERLDKERAEAYAAAVKYDAAKAQREAAENDLARVRRELEDIRSAEQEMERLLQQKKQILKQNGTAHGAEILQLEAELAELEAFEKELTEGIWAGNDVLDQIRRITGKLSSAEGWGTWDLVGGGLISGMAKHANLDEAQRMTEHLQVLLQRFRTELADVQVYADLKVNIDGFLRFADYFFDGLFADWAALDRIHNSQRQVADVKAQVEQTLWNLRSAQQKTAAERQEVQEKLKRLVLDA